MRNMYLTDKQYLQLLKRALKIVQNMSKVQAEDCTIRGCKDNTCNAGLCNDNQLCTPKIAMFPKDFPQRKDIKYLEDYQKCPLDWRTESQLDGNGCFYTCKIFQAKKKKIPNGEIVRLYKKQIKWAEDRIKNKPKSNTKMQRLVDQCYNDCIHMCRIDNNLECFRDQPMTGTTPCDLFYKEIGE